MKIPNSTLPTVFWEMIFAPVNTSVLSFCLLPALVTFLHWCLNNGAYFPLDFLLHVLWRHYMCMPLGVRLSLITVWKGWRQQPCRRTHWKNHKLLHPGLLFVSMEKFFWEELIFCLFLFLFVPSLFLFGGKIIHNGNSLSALQKFVDCRQKQKLWLLCNFCLCVLDTPQNFASFILKWKSC